jgi:hypothetical protein
VGHVGQSALDQLDNSCTFTEPQPTGDVHIALNIYRQAGQQARVGLPRPMVWRHHSGPGRALGANRVVE